MKIWLSEVLAQGKTWASFLFSTWSRCLHSSVSWSRWRWSETIEQTLHNLLLFTAPNLSCGAPRHSTAQISVHVCVRRFVIACCSRLLVQLEIGAWTAACFISSQSHSSESDGAQALCCATWIKCLAGCYGFSVSSCVCVCFAKVDQRLPLAVQVSALLSFSLSFKDAQVILSKLVNK